MKNFGKVANKEIYYHVDKDNRTVVAMMHDTSLVAVDYLLGLAEKNPTNGVMILPNPSSYRAYLLMAPSYSARVHCHDEDEFDEETGKRLAKKKLLRNIRIAFDKRIYRYIKQLESHQKFLINDLREIKEC